MSYLLKLYVVTVILIAIIKCSITSTSNTYIIVNAQEDTNTPSIIITDAPITNSPTTSKPTTSPSYSPSTTPPSASPTQDRLVRDYIESKKDIIQNRVLVSYNRSSGQAYSSKQYTFDRLTQSLQTFGVDGFGADFQFNLYEGDGDKYILGLINLASFLANAMVESIEDDTCDELNWEEAGNPPLIPYDDKFAISNSCGMEGRSYQDENCALGTNEFLSCDADKSMQVSAVSRGTQVNAPPPLKCQPGNNFAGYWDIAKGIEVANVEFANNGGRTDTEACCWWGRGALSTKGVCNIGKMNYYLGKRGADLGRSTLYPTVDFCKFPESTCASAFGESLRWDSALFEWSERVQRYESNDWNFEDQLLLFVQSGMTDDTFINGVSRILSRGCHEAGCSKYGEARLLNKRRTYFYMIINDVFDLKSLTRRPTPAPSKPIVETSISIESSASQQTPSPLSQDDLAAQLRPTLNGFSGPEPSSLVEDETAEPTTWTTLIVIEDNAAHVGKQMILLELLALMFLLLNHII